jgi:hypothetical protein
MFEAELGEFFQGANVAMFFSERGSFDLREVFEPPDPAGADWFIPVIG